MIFLKIFDPLIEVRIFATNRVRGHPIVSFTLNLDGKWLNAILSVEENDRMATFQKVLG